MTIPGKIVDSCLSPRLNVGNKSTADGPLSSWASLAEESVRRMRSVKEKREEDLLYSVSTLHSLRSVEQDREQVDKMFNTKRRRMSLKPLLVFAGQLPRLLRRFRDPWVEEPSHENISFRWNIRELGYLHDHCNPATQPAHAKLFITFSTQPWMTVVDASDVSMGVSIWDVQRQILSFLMTYTTRLEFEAQDEETRQSIEQSFWNNRSPEVSFYGSSRLGPGIRRFDWLCEQTTFGGLVLEDRPDILEQFGSDELHVPVIRVLCTSDDEATAYCKCCYFACRSG